MNKKYPIGTRIRYIGSCKKCKNKVGKVVEMREKTCIIMLPQSPCGIFRHNGTMVCPWSNIEPLTVKGQQLLFEFAYE
jgi:hypothetical protein